MNNHWAFSLSYIKKDKPLQFKILENRNQIFFDLPTIKKNLILILPPSISLSNVLSLSLYLVCISNIGGLWGMEGTGEISSASGDMIGLYLHEKDDYTPPASGMVFGPAQG